MAFPMLRYRCLTAYRLMPYSQQRPFPSPALFPAGVYSYHFHYRRACGLVEAIGVPVFNASVSASSMMCLMMFAPLREWCRSQTRDAHTNTYRAPRATELCPPARPAKDIVCALLLAPTALLRHPTPQR